MFRFEGDRAFADPGGNSFFRFKARPGRRVVGLVLRHTGSAADPRHSDGFAVVEALYAEVPLKSQAEEATAEAAGRAEAAARASSLKYGGADGEGGRERAAVARRAAERDAAAANAAYAAALEARREEDRAREAAVARGRQGTRGRPSGLKSTPTPEGARPAPVRVTFANNFGERVRVAWVDYRGKELTYCHLDREQHRTIESFAGHCWVVRSVATEEIAHAARCTREKSQTMWIGGEVKIL